MSANTVGPMRPFGRGGVQNGPVFGEGDYGRAQLMMAQ